MTFAQPRVKIVSGRKTTEVIAIEFSHLIFLEESRYWIQQGIRCMTPYIPCSRGRHVPVPYIWIAYADAGAHTCEHTLRSPSHSSARSHEKPNTRGKDLERIHNADMLHIPSWSPPRRGGVLYIACYWICLKLFKFKRRRMFFVVCNSSKRAATPFAHRKTLHVACVTVMCDNWQLQTNVCVLRLSVYISYIIQT